MLHHHRYQPHDQWQDLVEHVAAGGAQRRQDDEGAQRDDGERQDIADGPAGRLGGCIAFLLVY